MAKNDSDYKDLLRLKTGGYASRGLGVSFDPSDPFRFVSDEDRRDVLMNSGHFQLVEGKRLGAVLGGKQKDVVELIDSGECDEILDFLIHAERRHKGRSAVLNAIVSRSEVLAVAEDEDGDGEDPGVAARKITTSR